MTTSIQGNFCVSAGNNIRIFLTVRYHLWKIISQLVEARLEKGISQAELARMIGTQRSNICRLESGTQNPTLDMIVKIASALGKDVSLLLNDKEGEGCDH